MWKKVSCIYEFWGKSQFLTGIYSTAKNLYSCHSINAPDCQHSSLEFSVYATYVKTTLIKCLYWIWNSHLGILFCIIYLFITFSEIFSTLVCNSHTPAPKKNQNTSTGTKLDYAGVRAEHGFLSCCTLHWGAVPQQHHPSSRLVFMHNTIGVVRAVHWAGESKCLGGCLALGPTGCC